MLGTYSSTKEISMNMYARLSFLSAGIIGLAVFAFGFMSSGELSDGQNLMMWSTIPLAGIPLTGAFHTKANKNGVIAIMSMFVGIFFAMLCIGIFKQSGEIAAVLFAWLGIIICGTSVGMMLLDSIIPSTNLSRN